MKKKLFILLASVLVLIAASVPLFRKAETKKLPLMENAPATYSHDETLAVTAYEDVTAHYDTVDMEVKNIELRGNKLTFSLFLQQKPEIERISFGSRLMGNVIVSADPDFSDVPEYGGQFVLEDAYQEIELYTLTAEQLEKAERLYMRFPPAWVVCDIDPTKDDFESTSPLPDTEGADFDESGVYTGSLDGFTASYKGDEWFSVTGLRRYKAKNTSGRVRYYIEMNIESCGGCDVFPGIVCLNDKNGKYPAVMSRYEDPATFAKGTAGVLSFEVSKPTYKEFTDCGFYIRDISRSELCDITAVLRPSESD